MSDDIKDSSKIRRAGDVDFRSVIIIGSSGIVQDITPQVQAVELIENIFEPFTTGILTVADGIDIANILPIIGNEVVKIEFATPTLEDQNTYSRSFRVYNCTDKIKTTERNAVYQIRFISAEAFADKALRLSQTFRGTPSEIAKSIVFEKGLQSPKLMFCEDTSNNITFIANWWNPTKCLQYCASRALNANKSATYLFYETNSGFMFVSLDRLVSASTYQTFNVNNYANKANPNENSTTTPDIDRDYQTVLQIQYQNGFDFFERLSTGFYGSEVIGFDGNTGQYIHARPANDFDDENHLNKYTPVPITSPATTSSYIQYIPFVTQNFTGQNQGVYDSDLTYRSSRQQFISRLNTNKATIKVHGRCDYFPGMVIQLNVPKDAQITKDTTITQDQLVSGRYIVASIKHIVSAVRHTCIIQLMKDSYIFDTTKGGLETENIKQSTNKDQTTGGD